MAAVGTVAMACSKPKLKQAVPVPTAQARRGGTLNLATPGDFTDFDPAGDGSAAPNWDITSLAYDTLLDFARDSSLPYDEVELRPRLAERWESPDGLTLTLHLRPGVRFSDASPAQGRSLASADVRSTLEYVTRTGSFGRLPPATYAFLLSSLDSIQIPDASTVVLRLSAPCAPLLTYLSTTATLVLPHEIVDQDGSFHGSAAGSGPYELNDVAGQTANTRLLKRNAIYWGQPPPNLDGVRFLVLAQTDSRLTAFRNGQIDMLVLRSNPKFATAAHQASPFAVIRTSVEPLPRYLLLNGDRAQLGDERVRRAISLAIDRDEFDSSMNGGPLPWTAGVWSEDEVRKASTHDPAETLRLLNAAGASAVSLPFLAAADDDPAELQLLQTQLRKSGIALQPETVDRASWRARIKQRDFAAVFGGTALADPDSWLYGFHFSAGPKNVMGVDDPKLDAMIVAQRRELDPAKRQASIKDAMLSIADAAYAVAVHGTAVWDFWQPYVKNYSPHWVQHDFEARDLWLDK